MNFDQVKKIARDRGVKAGRLKKADLIRAIQTSEGNPACFDTGRIDQCGERDCLWREGCR